MSKREIKVCYAVKNYFYSIRNAEVNLTLIVAFIFKMALTNVRKYTNKN